MPECDLPILPAWRADETLFSWCSGYHRITGAVSARATSLELFGKAYASRQTDVSSRVGHFCLKTNGKLGSAQDVLQSRTTLGYLTRLLPPHMRVHATTPGDDPYDSAKRRARVGRRHSGLGSTLRLKACPACNRESIARFGLPIWRLQHQLPLSLYCLEHHCGLIGSEGEQSLWRLPDTSLRNNLVSINDSVDADAAARLARTELTFLTAPGRCTLDYLRKDTVVALARIGAAKPHLGIQPELLAKWLYASDTVRLLAHNMGGEAQKGVDEAVRQVLGRGWVTNPAPWSLVWSVIGETSACATEWLTESLARESFQNQLSLPFG